MKVEQINKLVIEGKIPISYFNCEVVSLNKINPNPEPSPYKLSKKYNQLFLRKSPLKLISRIYEFS